MIQQECLYPLVEIKALIMLEHSDEQVSEPFKIETDSFWLQICAVMSHYEAKTSLNSHQNFSFSTIFQIWAVQIFLCLFKGKGQKISKAKKGRNVLPNCYLISCVMFFTFNSFKRKKMKKFYPNHGLRISQGELFFKN